MVFVHVFVHGAKETINILVISLIQSKLHSLIIRESLVQNNDDLILAVQSAGVTRGRNSFRKDKGGEKLLETEADLLQHRTDGTDAFDTLYIGCEKFPFHDHLSSSMGGVL